MVALLWLFSSSKVDLSWLCSGSLVSLSWSSRGPLVTLVWSSGGTHTSPLVEGHFKVTKKSISKLTSEVTQGARTPLFLYYCQRGYNKLTTIKSGKNARVFYGTFMSARVH